MDAKSDADEGFSKPETVKVIVRCRPMSEKEKSSGYANVVKLYPNDGAIEVQLGNSKKYFTFDAVYDGGSQIEIFDEVFRPLVDDVIGGYNCTIFAYGQTGAGKTHTMEGVLGDPELEGVIPNSFRHIFTHISRTDNTQFVVTASYMEIYQEEVRDLLSADPKRKLEVRERNDTGVYVKDLTVCVCKTVDDLQKVMVDGKRNRSIGMTNMNAHSSRSHAIFIIAIESCEKSEDDSQNHIKMGKLNLVDLAGSEKQSKTGAMGLTQKESIKINLSLSALGNVISALVDGKSTHVPYRDSKLTRLLQDSLGGNAKTLMIANIGPASYNVEETVTTLRYASRAKNIKNKPKVNIDPKDAIILKYKEEISKLRAQLAAKRKKKKEPKAETVEKSLNSIDRAELVSKMENLLMEERVAFLNEQNLLSEEKEKILSEIKAKEDELKAENEAKEKIERQLQELEAKLLCGGKNIIDHTNEQQRILEKRRQDIAEQKIRERDIKQRLQEEEFTTLEKRETYTSLQSEVDIKTRKLKKLFQRLQAIKDDINDDESIFSFERQEKEQAIESLTRDIKLSNLVIDNFVNPEEKAKFLANVKYDEDEDAWVIYPANATYDHYNSSAERPLSANQHRRPTTSYALRMSRLTSKTRFKSENIVTAELCMPKKRTIDCDPPSTVDPYIKQAVEEVLKDTVFSVNAVHQSRNTIPTSGRLKYRSSAESHIARPTRREESEFPVPRGLVPKSKSGKMKPLAYKM